MRKPQHTPELPKEEQAEIDARKARTHTQPYATEIDNRELETAHKEKRPVQPEAPPRKP